MKDYVEKQLDEKRYALMKANRESYEARRQECIDIVKKKVAEFRKEVDLILVEFGMDDPSIKRNENGYNPHEIINMHSNYIMNDKEETGHRNYDRNLRDRQKEMLAAFYLECDLGINKDEFMEAVAKMNFD